MIEENKLEPLTSALAALPVPKSRATGMRWLRRYPGLGLTIGRRHYLWVEAPKAIARGVPLEQAARIGMESAGAA